MGDHDCLPLIKGYADKIDEQAGLLEHRDAHEGDFGSLHWYHHATQLSEIGLEPAGTAEGAMGDESEYPTIGPFDTQEGLLLETNT